MKKKPESLVALTISSSSSSSSITSSSLAMLRSEVLALKAEMIANRRHLHQWPELKFEEVKTRQFIHDFLTACGLEIHPHPVAVTGLVAILRGSAERGVTPPLNLALRADMDALPLKEQATEVNAEYQSKNGNAHACGHDGHVAILLCVAKVLSAWRDRICGSIKFLFQPGEEGGAGAKIMVQEGVLTSKIGGFDVDEVYGLHLWNTQLPGTVGVMAGPVMANRCDLWIPPSDLLSLSLPFTFGIPTCSDRFWIDIVGKGGHGSMPHQTVDVMPIASILISTIQTIVSRGIDPLESAVISVGSAIGGSAANVIAETMRIEGTVRTFTAANQNFIMARLEEICRGLGVAFRCKINLEYKVGYPSTVNK